MAYCTDKYLCRPGIAIVRARQSRALVRQALVAEEETVLPRQRNPRTLGFRDRSLAGHFHAAG